MNLLISFSGGETSAYMTRRLLEKHRSEYEQVIVVFANTGLEHEKTLEFVDQCDREFGFNVVWVESVPGEKMGVGVSAKIVDFSSASRKGEPFEAMIAKFGIPNQAFQHCSRELKRNVIRAYARLIGWSKRDYYTAIGIRADEFDRMSADAEEDRLIYPLITWGIDKPEVNRFWNSQSFRLEIKSYEGNCVTCWKKSERKLLTLAKESPCAFNFFREMEQKYENYAPPRPGTPKFPLRFFRGNLSVDDIFVKSKNDFQLAADDRFRMTSVNQLSLFTSSPEEDFLDTSAGCSESCEAF